MTQREVIAVWHAAGVPGTVIVSETTQIAPNTGYDNVRFSVYVAGKTPSETVLHRMSQSTLESCLPTDAERELIAQTWPKVAQ